jgi:hypothetical protein
MTNSISLSGGIPGSSSGNTSGYSRTTGTSSIDLCRGQPRGSPKKPGEILLKTCKKTQNANPTSGLTQNIQRDPRRGGPAPHRSGPAKRPLERGPPRSRAQTPSMRSISLEGSRHPGAGSASLEGPRLPRARSASLEGPS